MKSRISIEVDFENNNQPVIQILQTNDSDDVRDQLISHFCKQFHGSSWCQIKWVTNLIEHETSKFNRIHITPIKPEQLEAQSKVMLEQHELNAKYYSTQ